ncbi:hypothetical protein KL941_005443, partial [Ogataea angusta]
MYAGSMNDSQTPRRRAGLRSTVTADHDTPRYHCASQSLGQRKPLKQHTCRVAETQIAQVEAAAHPR